MAGTARLKALRVAFCIAAIAALAVPLVFTFSRGAWLGCALGLAYLFVQRCRGETGEMGSAPAPGAAGRALATGNDDSNSRNDWLVQSLPSSVRGRTERQPGRLRSPRLLSWCSSNALWIAIAVALLGITAFWLFRFTEFKPVRRAFSVGNINDSSWRMRVEAWEGALNIMAHSPWVGSEWKKPEITYYQFFQKPKVLEGAAIQLNDYFIVGMTWGIPVLAGFAAWVWSAFRPRCNGGIEAGGDRSRPGCSSVRPRAELESVRTDKKVPGLELPMQPAGAQSATPVAGALPIPTEPVSREAQDEWLKATCRAAVVVLLVGFWFDGGLFKWALAVPFWLLLEMGRSHPLWERRSAQV